MKKLTFGCIILTVCVIAAFVGCKKNGTLNYHEQGVITFSVGCCPMCQCASLSGYNIQFNSDTVHTSHHISNDISKFGINANSKFPVNVIVNWQPDNSVQGGNYVTITQLQIVN
ncbi:MAG: hypothetical protein ACXVB0_21180 [Mucilaginibacter sp.]